MAEVDLSNPFTWLNSINQGKDDLIGDSDDPVAAEKAYNSFMTNRGLSFFPDTIMFANEMNLYYNADNKMKYDFFRLGIRKRKRFSKWWKPEKNDDVEIIMLAYKYSKAKAQEVLQLFSREQLDSLKEKMSEGGYGKESR